MQTRRKVKGCLERWSGMDGYLEYNWIPVDGYKIYTLSMWQFKPRKVNIGIQDKNIKFCSAWFLVRVLQNETEGMRRTGTPIIMDKIIQQAIEDGIPLVCLHSISNYGDLLNIPLLNKYFRTNYCYASYQYLNDVPESVNIFMGAGTLIGYIVPLEWFRNRHITFLGTGAIVRTGQTKVFNDCHGFVRGPISEAITGVPHISDLLMLVNQVFSTPSPREDRTAIVIDKCNGDCQFDLPHEDRFHVAPITEADLESINRRIASATYVVTDRLHVAISAEVFKIPWVIWNHKQGDLIDHFEKFYDWAESIGKAKFIIDNARDVKRVFDNHDFRNSAEKIKAIDNRLRELLAAGVGSFA